MKKIITLVLILSSLYSCTNESNKIRSITSLGLLKGEPLYSSTISVPYDLIVVDSFLVVLNSKGEFLFEVYSTNSFQKLTQFGVRGKGPSEFINPVFPGQVSDLTESNSMLYVYDSERRRITKIDLYQVLQDNYEFDVFRLPIMDVYVQKVFYTNSELIISKGEWDKGRFQLYNKGSKRTKTVGWIPKFEIDCDRSEISEVYHSTTLCVNPQREEIAVAPYYFGNIDFFDFQGEYLRSIRFSDIRAFEKCLKADCFSNDSYDMFIYDMELCNDNIYGLNMNNTPGNLLSGNHNNLKIIRFDWDGTSLEEYELDQLIDNFTFDEHNNCFFAINSTREDTPFIKFQIPVSK